MKKVIIAIFLLLVFAIPANAKLVKEQGIGDITYTGWGSPSAKVKQQAVQKAKVNALTRFTGKFDQSKMMNYEKIRTKVEADIDRYVTDYQIIDEDTNKKSKRFRVVIQASINATLIDVELQKSSAIQQVPDDERSLLSFVFVAREATAVKKYDARRTQRMVLETNEDQSESTTAEDGQLGFSAQGVKDIKKTTGGSTLQKADQIKYDVSNAREINTAMSNIFSTAGFEVVEAEYLTEETNGLVDVDKFVEDFRYGDDISGGTRRAAVKGCRGVDVYLFAVGTLDVGMKDKDPVSGLTRVYVSVTGKVLNLKNRFPKTIASVGPVQYAGLGPDQTVAKRNALILAGEKAAKELTAQLRAKGVN
jgi:hypothetical protein